MSQEKNVQTTRVTGVDMKLEVVVIPVADVERSKEFYQRLGWRLDATPSGVGPVYAAGLGMLRAIRWESHDGCAGFRAGSLAHCL